MIFNRRMLLAATLASSLVAGSALAQAAAPQILRGVVTAVEANALTIKGKDKKLTTINMAPGWTVSVMKPVTMAEVKPGSFIGTAEMPQEDGTGKSLEVHVFPPGVKMGEGHYPWDLKKGSMMTNGTVGKVVPGKKGQELEVSYNGQPSRKIVVPKRVPIMMITPADKAMVKKGTNVFLVAFPTPKGLVANAVSTGVGGKAPAM